ncbi:MAG: methionyl-tRNA formyltransferase [Candidatus Synoicihabitans palmerolidicus]|nr:methionyl-tRNA formyltransferase [Candidatus Synoicihabitans palmerolidicus]
MGSDPIALPLLDWFLGQEGRALAQISTVYTQPDRPVGRGQRFVANEIKQWASAHGIEVRQPEKLTAEARARLTADAPDLTLVMAYGHILGEKFIQAPRLGTLNLHASLLPKYRGASPIQTAIASGDAQTGVALMRIVRELDAGPVADVESVDIETLDTGLDIKATLAAACVPLVSRNLPRLAAGELAFVPQDHAGANFCRRLIKDDGVLDFTRPARAVSARINGLFPWPGCRTEINGQIIKLGQADTLEGQGEPGSIISNFDQELLVSTPQGLVRLLKLQRPGGRMLPTADFLRGFTVEAGTILPSVTMPTLVRTQS